MRIFEKSQKLLKIAFSWLFVLAHPSRRLDELLPSLLVRRPSCVNFLHFHLLLQNRWADFNQTWWGSSFGGRDPKLFMGSMWPPGGPRGRAPKGKKGVNFKNLLLQTQKQYRLDFLHVDT